MKANGNRYNLQGKDFLDLWKHYEDAGGGDKNRMVTIVTWFLAFAVTIIGYILTKCNFCNSPDEKQVVLTIILDILGLMICIISLYFVYAYSSYANFNWYVADRIMKEKIMGLTKYHDRAEFQKEIEFTAERNSRKMSIEQKILNRLIKKKNRKCSFDNPNEYETAKGLVGVFKGMRNIILFLLVIFVAILILTILVKLNNYETISQMESLKNIPKIK